MVIYNKKSKIEYRVSKVFSNTMEDVGALLVFGKHK